MELAVNIILAFVFGFVLILLRIKMGQVKSLRRTIDQMQYDYDALREHHHSTNSNLLQSLGMAQRETEEYRARLQEPEPLPQDFPGDAERRTERQMLEAYKALDEDNTPF